MAQQNRGSLLRQARRRVRLSQLSLAELSGLTQCRISRLENGHLELLDRELDDLLLLCGARRTGFASLDSIMQPLGGTSLRWYGSHEPLEKLRLASAHCAALGTPLAGLTWPALLGVLRLVAAVYDPPGAPGCAIGGVVARALDSPDRTNDADIDEVTLFAIPGHETATLPQRLPTVKIRILAAEPADLAGAWWWPLPSSWEGSLRFMR